MKIDLKLSSKWFFSDAGLHTNTIRAFLEELEGKWESQFTKTDSSLTECRIEYKGGLNIRSVVAELKKTLNSVTGQAFDDSIFMISLEADGKKYSVGHDGELHENKSADSLIDQIRSLMDKQKNDDSKEPEAVSDKKAEKESAPVTHADGDQKKRQSEVSDDRAADTEEKEEEEREAYSKICDLVGCDSLKQLATDIREMAGQVIAHKTQGIFFKAAYLFSVDAGHGYHTALQLLEELYKEVGLFEDPAKPQEMELPAFEDDDVARKMDHVTEALKSTLRKQRLVTIDITGWLGHTHSSLFKKMALQIFRDNSKCAIVFKIPYVKPALIDATIRDLSDVITTTPIVFEPFSNDELKEIAQRYLDEHGFAFTEQAWDLFGQQIAKEKGDGYFYGVYTVHKLVGDIIRQKELILAKTGENGMLISDEISGSFDTKEENTESDGLDALRSMIGMEAIAQKVENIINQIVYARQGRVSSIPTMHMFFVGNPGTGKTTVARIIGKVLKERGILRVGKFFEHHARDLCAKYVGHTAPQTRKICEEAYGSVLFIDEAYSLYQDDGRYDYGAEAIDTLIAEMENHRDDLIVIFAGYPDEIDKMISSNPGMTSRVPFRVEFPNYTREQMAEIFMRMVDQNFEFTSDLEAHVKEYFAGMTDEVLSDRSFGNARFVRNLFERTWSKALARRSKDSNSNIVVNCDDFDAAAQEFGGNGTPKPDRKIGF